MGVVCVAMSKVHDTVLGKGTGTFFRRMYSEMGSDVDRHSHLKQFIRINTEIEFAPKNWK